MIIISKKQQYIGLLLKVSSSSEYYLIYLSSNFVKMVKHVYCIGLAKVMGHNKFASM